MVAERVEHTVAAASARCEREGESQAPQQKDTELRTGDGHVIAGGQNVEVAGGELPCLREQQRTRRRSEVSKMRLIRALIARTGSDALPSPERPGVVSTVRGGGDGDGAGAKGLPILAPRNQHGAAVSGCGLLRRPMARPRRPARQRGDGRPQQAPWPG